MRGPPGEATGQTPPEVERSGAAAGGQRRLRQTDEKGKIRPMLRRKRELERPIGAFRGLHGGRAGKSRNIFLLASALSEKRLRCRKAGASAFLQVDGGRR